MTYENCLKYSEEAKKAGNEELADFWKKRAERRSKPIIKEEVKEEIIEEVKEVKPKKKGKK